jgi:hypothetical protein
LQVAQNLSGGAVFNPVAQNVVRWRNISRHSRTKCATRFRIAPLNEFCAT